MKARNWQPPYEDSRGADGPAFPEGQQLDGRQSEPPGCCLKVSAGVGGPKGQEPNPVYAGPWQRR